MPSSSSKQAKTMSAIAHGWKPKGSAAGIPVKVAKEFHAADKGKKYGAGGKDAPKDNPVSDQAKMLRNASGKTVHAGSMLTKEVSRGINHVNRLGSSDIGGKSQVGMKRNAKPKIRDSYGSTSLHGYYQGPAKGGAPWPGHEVPGGPMMPVFHAPSSNTAPHAHGYGHSTSNRRGALRLSGSSKAHQIGRK
jgi:hypothetical protein